MPPTPSAKSTLLFGTSTSGTFIKITSDLYGIATLVSETNAGRKSAQGKQSRK